MAEKASLENGWWVFKGEPRRNFLLLLGSMDYYDAV